MNPSPNTSLVVAVALSTALAAAACQNGQTPQSSTGGPPPEESGSEEAPVASATHAAAEAPRVGDPADWCAGHGVPESSCTVCNPGLVEQFRSSGDWCAGHGYPESVCPFCNPMQPPGTAVSTGEGGSSAVAAGTRIRFRSTAVERAAGIETVPATTDTMGIGVETTARIDFDRNALAEVRSSVPGIVRDVSVDLGQTVAAGDALFTVESAHVGDLQARRSAARERVEVARANLSRQQGLREGAVVSQRQVELARQDAEAADAELRSIDQALRISGAPRGGRTGQFIVPAPIAGSLVRRPGMVGTFAGESESLATIADTTTMWALLDVPEWDASAVRSGQRVEVHVDGVPDRAFVGTVTWLASEVDPRTRTVATRAELENPDGLLRAGQFARGTVHLESPAGATTVPLVAVQRVGDASVVFVRTEEGVYEPRTVQPGRSDGRRVQIGGDVHAGDAVVTTGAFLLRTELSRDSIGAGCCEVEAPRGD